MGEWSKIEGSGKLEMSFISSQYSKMSNKILLKNTGTTPITNVMITPTFTEVPDKYSYTTVSDIQNNSHLDIKYLPTELSVGFSSEIWVDVIDDGIQRGYETESYANLKLIVSCENQDPIDLDCGEIEISPTGGSAVETTPSLYDCYFDYSHDAHQAFVGIDNPKSDSKSLISENIIGKPITCSANDWVGWVIKGTNVTSHSDLNDPMQVGCDFVYRFSKWITDYTYIDIYYLCEDPNGPHYDNPCRQGIVVQTPSTSGSSESSGSIVN